MPIPPSSVAGSHSNKGSEFIDHALASVSEAGRRLTRGRASDKDGQTQVKQNSRAAQLFGDESRRVSWASAHTGHPPASGSKASVCAVQQRLRGGAGQC